MPSRNSLGQFVGLMGCCCFVLFFASVGHTAGSPRDGGRSVYEPQEAERRRKEEESKRRAAEIRAEIQRKSEEIERKAAKIRAENDRRRANSTRKSNETGGQNSAAKPKVIEVEYESEGSTGSAGTGQPKVVSIKGQTEESNRTADRKEQRTAGPQANRNDEHHYTLTPPHGWKAMTSMELSQCNLAALGRGFGAAVQYHAGFRPVNAQAGSPYILIQAKVGKIKSYQEVEAAVARELPAAARRIDDTLRDLSNLSVGSAIVDRSKNRVVMRMEMDVQGVGTLHSLSVGHLGSDRIVYVHCYAQKKDFSRYLPTFERINDWFQYDEGHAFVPRDREKSNPATSDTESNLTGSVSWEGWRSGAMIGGLVGGFVGAVALLFRKIMKSGRSAPEQLQFDSIGNSTNMLQDINMVPDWDTLNLITSRPSRPSKGYWVGALVCAALGAAGLAMYGNESNLVPEEELTEVAGVASNVEVWSRWRRYGSTECMRFSVGDYETYIDEYHRNFNAARLAVANRQPLRVWLETKKEYSGNTRPLYKLMAGNEMLVAYADKVEEQAKTRHACLVVGIALLCISGFQVGITVYRRRRYAAYLRAVEMFGQAQVVA